MCVGAAVVKSWLVRAAMLFLSKVISGFQPLKVSLNGVNTVNVISESSGWTSGTWRLRVGRGRWLEVMLVFIWTVVFPLPLQLGAEQRAREEDRERHDDHQPQHGADWESRGYETLRKHCSLFKMMEIWCLIRKYHLTKSVCLQVSLWAELWPAPGRPCLPGSPPWPSPQL